MKYILNTTWNQLGLRQTLFMFRRACVVLFCWACCVAGATDVHFDLSKFNVNPVGGRTVLLQPLQPIAGNLITNVSDDNGEFTYSNAGRGTNPVDYVVSVRALGAASKIDFQITVLSTNLGTVEADAITSQLGVQTYPTAGKSSWTIQSQEARYQLNGTTLSNTFYPLFSNPSNYAPISFLQATNLALSNQIFVTSNALQIALGAAGISAVTATNIATNQVFLATNGFTSVVYSNGNVFVNTNLLFVTSNALAGQIPAAGISALTSTNIATNQVFLGTNNIGIASSLSAMVSTNRFDVSGVGIAAATAATNAAGIASGLSAYVSTNRFDVAGAATAVTNGYPWGSLYDASGLAAGVQTFSTGVSNSVLVKANTNQPTLFNPTNHFDSTLTNSFNDFKGKVIADLYVGTTNVGRLEAGHAGNVFNIGRDDTLGFLFWGLDDTGSISDTNPKQILGGFTGYGDFYVKQRLYVGGTQLIFDTDNDAPNVTIRTSQGGGQLFFEQPPTMSGANISLLPATQLTGTIPQGALPTSVVTNNFKGTVTAQGFGLDQWVIQTNAANHSLNISNTTYAGNLTLATNGALSVLAGSTVNFSVSSSGLALMKTAGFSTYAAAAGRSNFITVNQFGLTDTNDVGNFVSSIIAGTAGANPPLTNAYGTNLPNGLVAGQRLYFPTNYDLAGGSNTLYTMQLASNALWAANKLDKTNGAAYGLASTNTALLGSVSFGRDGTSTNIIGGTNFLAFVNAGSSVTTNGAFIWDTVVKQYTNWLTGGILTNNGTVWVMITNGVPLYSLAGASPFGQYAQVSGASPAPVAVSSAAINDHMVMTGYWSVTNQNAQLVSAITAATNSLLILITNGTTSGSIATSNGFGTNTTLRFGLAAWGIGNTAGGAYSASLAGLSNNVSAAGSVVVGGIGNSATGVAGYNFIGGGLGNVISAGAAVIGGGTSNFIDLNNNNSFIGGGSSNRIENNNALSASILGGNYNKIAFGSISGGANYAVILGGQFNTNKGAYSIIGGHNFTASNDNVFGWSDGTVAISKTNSQMYASATNGLYVDGPIWHGFNSTNGGAYFISNTVSTAFSIYAVTNSMPNFSYWMGESNGIMVMIYYSNNVSFMKNMWP